MNEVILVQSPTPQAAKLVLLFHGVGASAHDLVPLARTIAAAFPQAAVASVQSPFPSDLGGGRQWFSVLGVTEANRPARIAAAMPLFAQTVREIQDQFGVGPEATTLIGFSQGAIMSLESTLGGQSLASRIVSLSGRFAQLPLQAPDATTLHFIHGEADPVIPGVHAVQAAQRVRERGGAATLDVLPRMGHEITKEVADLVVQHLQE